jgi:uncharacterized oxidoreductase
MKLQDHVVVITGGASGIGLALARALHEKGNQVVIAGRSPGKLAEVKQAHPELDTVECDVTNTAQVKAALATVVGRHGRLSILVNNAGIMAPWNVLKEPGEDRFATVDHEVATNYLAPIKVATLALPYLLAQPEAAIVNVTSGLAYLPIAAFPVYCGTKAALHSFSKSLRHQLRDTHVKVFDVLPPGTDTGLVDEMRAAGQEPKFKMMSPEAVAKEALRGMHKDHYEIPIGQSKTIHIMERIAPGFIEQQLLRAQDD